MRSRGADRTATLALRTHGRTARAASVLRKTLRAPLPTIGYPSRPAEQRPQCALVRRPTSTGPAPMASRRRRIAQGRTHPPAWQPALVSVLPRRERGRAKPRKYRSQSRTLRGRAGEHLTSTGRPSAQHEITPDAERGEVGLRHRASVDAHCPLLTHVAFTARAPRENQ